MLNWADFYSRNDAPKRYNGMVEDIRLNEFGSVNEIAELLGLDYNGNGCFILPQTLFAPLFQVRGTVKKSLNDCTDSGIYGINKDVYNTGVCSYGMLIVFNATNTSLGGNPITQFVINSDGVIFTRMKWYQADFTSWKTISFT